eukprot:COSAG01_NODE_722_length_14067_cov_145.626289_1_plen_630_part_00
MGVGCGPGPAGGSQPEPPVPPVPMPVPGPEPEAAAAAEGEEEEEEPPLRGATAASAEGAAHATLEISPDEAHRMIDAMKRNARGNIEVPALLAELGGWGEEVRAFHAGQAATGGHVLLPMRRERVSVSRPWQPPIGGVVVDNRKAWGEAWQWLGAADPVDALMFLGCFMRLAFDKPLSLVSTKYMTPAKQWAELVKREEEVRHGAPCFNPNEDNVNLCQLVGEDQDLRDFRWLLVFKWCAKVAALTGGCMIQLRIPGFGLSPMQLAEQQIAAECGLQIDERVLDAATGARLADLPADFDLAPMFREGSQREAKLEAWVAQLSDGDAAMAEGAAKALAVLALEGDNKVAIVRAGALVPLVALLIGGSERAREEAAGALKNLAVNDDNKVAIMRAEALAPLIVLLSEGSEGAREEAGGALRNLACQDDNTVAIVRAGALAPLIVLLSEGSAEARENAAAVLRNLAVRDDNRVAIVRAGALAPLIVLLSEGSARAQERAAGAVRDMAVNDDNKVAIVRAGALAPLIVLLSEGSAGGREAAVGALRNLTAGATGIECQAAVVSAGGPAAVVTALRAHPREAVLQAQGILALFNMRKTPQGEAAVQAAGGRSVIENAAKNYPGNATAVPNRSEA